MDVDGAEQLSEGEVVEDKTPESGCSSEKNSSSRERVKSSSSGAPTGEEDGCDEPNAKKRRLSSPGEDKSDGEWEEPTRRQKKKMRQRTRREKRLYQKMEKNAVAKLPQSAPTGSQICLNPRQSEVVGSLAAMCKGEQRKRAMVGKLKTLQFQSVVSHLVSGSPSLSEPKEAAAELQRDYRVVVAWLSMISSDFVRNYPNNFSKVKQLSPCVMFDVEHPGSSTFVKLGLESFMMLTGNEQNPSPLATSASSGSPNSEPPSRYKYLLSNTSLSDNDFPNPTLFDVDPLGREVRGYMSITEWPSCEIKETPQVVAGMNGKEQMPLIAIDCEMVETERGSELARISVVGEDLKCMYDTLVKPDLPVVDYRTKYSGLDESSLESVTTTIKDVHENLASIIPPNSILVGHSLENDFHAMKFRHPFVIDTSYLFTPTATPTMKPGLRKICKHLLQTDIQSTDKGHDSIEDAVSCMKLVQLKLEKGESCTFPFHEISPSIFTDFRVRGCTSSIIDKDSVLRTFGKGSSISEEASTDQEAVEKAAAVIPQSKFTFLQFHSMEYLLKSENASDNDKIKQTAEELDSLVVKLVESCPEKTVVFVMFGSGDIRKVRKLQQGSFPDHKQLKKQVMLARTGCVIGLVIN